MRLTDADKIIEHLEKVKKESASLVDVAHIIGFQSVIDTQPTAYDVDKVVEQLKTDSLVKLYGSGNSDNYLIPVKRAIEIVKAGGING